MGNVSEPLPMTKMRFVLVANALAELR